MNYILDYTVFDISLEAKDPVGYSFDQDIADVDIKEDWKTLRDNRNGAERQSIDQMTEKERLLKSADSMAKEAQKLNNSQ